MNDIKRQCTAHLTDGSGRRCRKSAILGGTVCGKHGGRAPQVKKSARARLDALVEPAIEALTRALKHKDVNAIIKAAQIVLDRCGYHPKSSMELSGPNGGPIQTTDNAWFEYLTVEEKRTVLEIAGRAEARMQESRERQESRQEESTSIDESESTSKTVEPQSYLRGKAFRTLPARKERVSVAVSMPIPDDCEVTL